MSYGFFLGCLIPLRYPGIESATRLLFERLDHPLKDLKGASCCPAPGVVRSFDTITWQALGARNLVLAEQQGVEMMTACNGCYLSLSQANQQLQDNAQREVVNGQLKGLVGPYGGTTKVRHVVEVLHREFDHDRLRELMVLQNNLKVAVHDGCHFHGPAGLPHEHFAGQHSPLDELVELTGAVSLEYADKGLCCGAGGGVRAREPELSLNFTRTKLAAMSIAGATCIVNGCPFCHLQYDRGQQELNLSAGTDAPLPVLHISQFLALAMGLPRELMGLELHDTPVPQELLEC